MTDPYPSFPAKTYRVSRLLRVSLFSAVASLVTVSVLIAFFQFVWDEGLRFLFHRPPYQARVEFVVPTMIIVAYVFGRLLWDAGPSGASSRSAQGAGRN